ncbi:DUF1289 domain-containing protein [Saccharophagus sp. K07]|jgi:predicted Fe-S protein YdhL (DUF1289 family)|uniref:DUF1289 domain-containing protein n=1 Tax=Saccharophagus sp. K07 TaxID=2283636 RepID=UPI001651F112|nr:DUF1289 domain-containing protein [Saccharophagus sp. K07]MBC6906886.1 DUF1289 domain-containing protein [Saccharophagus sp. K07]
MLTRIRTPCIGVCSTGIGDNVCRGCKRFAHEVIGWNSYTDAEREAIMQRIESLLTQVVENHIRVVDEKKLHEQMELQRVRMYPGLNIYCQAFEAIRAFGGKLKELEWIGCEAQLPYRTWSVAELKKAIDDAFFELSRAHYERYFSVFG